MIMKKIKKSDYDDLEIQFYNAFLMHLINVMVNYFYRKHDPFPFKKNRTNHCRPVQATLKSSETTWRQFRKTLTTVMYCNG